jgi:hypothetical protein
LTNRLDLEPTALATYRELRSDPTSELGKLVRDVLARLRDNPAALRANRAATRFSNGVWGFLIEAPDGRRWLIAWDEIPPDLIKVHYIGLAPGEALPGGPVYSSETDS